MYPGERTERERLRAAGDQPSQEQEDSRPVRSLMLGASFLDPTEVSDERRCLAAKRLQSELKDFKREPLENCTADLEGENLFRWNLSLLGPSDTPYEGGVFHLIALFPGDYPLSPPTVAFTTKIYHCNVGVMGIVCMDMLKDKWLPIQSIKSILLSLHILLAEPNPYDAMSVAIAADYRLNRRKHDTDARDWTDRYAKPKESHVTLSD